VLQCAAVCIAIASFICVAVAVCDSALQCAAMCVTLAPFLSFSVALLSCPGLGELGERSDYMCASYVSVSMHDA